MILRARAVASTFISLGLALYTQSAHADAAGAGANAAPTCLVQTAPYGKGIELPSNAPGLLLVDQTSSGLEAKVQATLIVGGERTSLGAPTKDARGLLMLALPTTTTGTHSLELEVECAGQGTTGQDPQTSTTTLTLTAPVTFPTAAGTLVHVPQSPPTGVDRVRFEPTPELRAFLAAARLEISVNGTFAERRLGPLQASNAPIELSVNTGDACIEDGALHREKRTVKVSLNAVIAGVATAPSEATIDVPVDCGAIQWTTGSEPGRNGAPGGTTSTTTEGTSSSSSSAASCSAAPVRKESFAGALAIAVASLVFAARRRRK